MLLKYSILDDKKCIMEKFKIERNKSKQHLEKYLMMYNIKEKDLIKNLADKLKLSEKFVKTLQF